MFAKMMAVLFFVAIVTLPTMVLGQTSAAAAACEARTGQRHEQRQDQCHDPKKNTDACGTYEDGRLFNARQDMCQNNRYQPQEQREEGKRRIIIIIETDPDSPSPPDVIVVDEKRVVTKKWSRGIGTGGIGFGGGKKNQ